MALYQNAQSGTIGALLRAIQEDRQASPLAAPPATQTESPIRGLVQQPLTQVEAPDSSRVIATRPELQNPESPASVVGPISAMGEGEGIPVPAPVPTPVAPITASVGPASRGPAEGPASEMPYQGPASFSAPPAPSAPNPTPVPTPSPFGAIPLATKITSAPSVKGVSTQAKPTASKVNSNSQASSKPQASPTPAPQNNRPGNQVPNPTPTMAKNNTPSQMRIGAPIVENKGKNVFDSIKSLLANSFFQPKVLARK